MGRTTPFRRIFGKKVLFAVWLLAPIPLLGLHFGPGQQAANGDQVATSINAALDAEAAERWDDAVDHWREAQGEVPADAVDEAMRIALSAEMARVYAGELPEALEATAALFDEAVERDASEKVQREIRGQLAAMHYWAAWLMRLEGAAAEEWEPVSEQARQHFRILAETKSPDREAHQRNLEAVIRLQRMDLSELQGLPLPKECKGTRNCSGRCKGQRQARLQKEGMSDQPKDGRQQVQEQQKAGAGVHNASDAAGW